MSRVMINHNRDTLIKTLDQKLEVKKRGREQSEQRDQKIKKDKELRELEFKKWLESRPEPFRQAEEIFKWTKGILNDDELLIRLKEFYDFFEIYREDRVAIEFSPKLESLFMTIRSKFGPGTSKKLSTPEEMVRNLDPVYISMLYRKVKNGEAWNSIVKEIENY